MRSNFFELSMIVVFGFLLLATLIGAFWNPGQLFMSLICSLMVGKAILNLRRKA